MKTILPLLVAAISLVGCSSSNGGTSSTAAAAAAAAGAGAGTGTGTGTTGSSGTTGTSGTTSTANNVLTGNLAFTVGKAIDLVNVMADGGEDPTYAGLDITDDSTDSCVDQEGYSDGGFPPADSEDIVINLNDPNGVQPNQAYPSLTLEQWEINNADGGLPSTAYAEAILYDGSNVYLAVGGTATLVQDTSTMEFGMNVTFNLDGTFSDGGISTTGSAQTLAGNGTPPSMCTVGFQE